MSLQVPGQTTRLNARLPRGKGLREEFQDAAVGETTQDTDMTVQIERDSQALLIELESLSVSDPTLSSPVRPRGDTVVTESPEWADVILSDLLDKTAKKNRVLLRVVLGAMCRLSVRHLEIALEMETRGPDPSPRPSWSTGGWDNHINKLRNIDCQRQQRDLAMLKNENPGTSTGTCRLFLDNGTHLRDSLRPYFLAQNHESTTVSRWKHSFQLSECDAAVAKLCLCHLNFNETMDIRYGKPDPIYDYWHREALRLKGNSQKLRLSDGDYPLLDYAVHNWAEHVRNAQVVLERDHQLMCWVRDLYTSGRAHGWALVQKCAVQEPMVLTRKRHQSMAPPDGTSNFALACHNGHEQVLKLLWETDNKRRYIDLAQGVQLAIIAGHLSTVQYLVRNWSCVNLMTVSEEPTSPLMTAVQHDRAEIVEILTQNGASIEQIHATVRRTPLEVAVLGQKTSIVQNLLKAPTMTPHTVYGKVYWLTQLAMWGQYRAVAILIQGADLNRVKPKYKPVGNPLFCVWANGTIGMDRLRMMQHLIVECPYLLDRVLIRYAVDTENSSFLDAALNAWGRAFGREAERFRLREVFQLGWNARNWRLLHVLMSYIADRKMGEPELNYCYK